jgi:hypothetical protein
MGKENTIIRMAISILASGVTIRNMARVPTMLMKIRSSKLDSGSTTIWKENSKSMRVTLLSLRSWCIRTTKRLLIMKSKRRKTQNKRKVYLKIDLLQMVVLELLLLLLLTDPKNFSELSLSTEPVKSVPTTMN